ncbi:MAG: hypothetical protein IJY59_02825, partial [Bacteroidaceae bacterium]|nr:hypothetical protein [Bacteroidaceae bacterium]
MGNEIATVRISEFFIVMLQCDNSDGANVIKEMQTKENDDNFLLSAFLFIVVSLILQYRAMLVLISLAFHPKFYM